MTATPRDLRQRRSSFFTSGSSVCRSAASALLQAAARLRLRRHQVERIERQLDVAAELHAGAALGLVVEHGDHDGRIEREAGQQRDDQEEARGAVAADLHVAQRRRRAAARPSARSIGAISADISFCARRDQRDEAIDEKRKADEVERAVEIGDPRLRTTDWSATSRAIQPANLRAADQRARGTAAAPKRTRTDSPSEPADAPRRLRAARRARPRARGAGRSAARCAMPTREEQREIERLLDFRDELERRHAAEIDRAAARCVPSTAPSDAADQPAEPDREQQASRRWRARRRRAAAAGRASGAR